LIYFKQLWRTSLLFRRLTALSVVAAAALLVYLGSNIPRPISLPADDLNARSTARIKEERIVIEKPKIAEGDLVLSYVGNKNEMADIWLEDATLDDRSQRLLFPGAAASAAGKISYTTSGSSGAKKSDDTCHTTIEVRRAKGSPAVDALTLSQTDEMAGAQRFRQVVVDAGKATMEVEVHTDSPEQGAMDLSGCHKLLTVGGGAPVDLPAIPVHMLVHGGKIDLHFNPVDASLPIWTGKDDTFEAVSLGDGSLRANGLQVISMAHAKAPRLDVREARGVDGITLNRLKLGSDALKVDIGRDTEKAVVRENGVSAYNYDLIAAIQKNPILSFVFAAVLVPALWKWVRKNCFPNMTE
jgi:hypothetical protein